MASSRRLQKLPFLVALLLFTCREGLADDQKETEESTSPSFTQFLDACTMGEIEVLEIMLEEHPELSLAQSEQGETCLHVAGIRGQTQVTKTILKAGGDVNVRSTFEQGLRMTPLAWNVYGGHVDTAKVLLEAGAKPNMDMDSMSNPEEKMTVLDIVNDGLVDDDGTDEAEYTVKYRAMKELLLSYGAKRFVDLADEQQI